MAQGLKLRKLINAKDLLVLLSCEGLLKIGGQIPKVWLAPSLRRRVLRNNLYVFFIWWKSKNPD